ncbi:excinuclease ABC subunit C [bacterium (Candidatus Torokbacteria) CG09_land_8_20_14_0_10_42_11]|nr:MAG: excinuclease ABC subunit C [bacterium (Candidatus Torokbacteria) CG09_land_8_20_14_0_10_42_11]
MKNQTFPPDKGGLGGLNLKISQANLPSAPGVYIFRDSKNRALYVGKAKNLKKRVASYFRKNITLAPDKKLMVPKIKKIEHISVDNETEALLLEHNLIKKYRPRYNIVFQDDKSYSYIKITNEKFPAVFLARPREAKDFKAAKFFGPYTSSENARETLKVLRQIFPFRSCYKMPKKSCLYDHLHLCPGPCEQKIEPQEYKKIIQEISRFLTGQHQEIIQNLKQEMETASKKQNFEKAAILRDRLFALAKIQEKQKVITRDSASQDILSLARAKKISAINLFLIRGGRLIAKENFLLGHTIGKRDAEIIQKFAENYYLRQETRPREIILPVKIKRLSFLKAKITIPQKGIKKKLLAMGAANAQEFLKEHLRKKRAEETKNQKALSKLASYLKLKKIPRRIETYDISNIQGQQATGSMVVFKNGKADKSAYRRFRIKTIKAANDTGMIAEVLQRRFLRSTRKSQKSWPMPDLILIDGGRGQLNAGLKILKFYHLAIPIAALAKKLEEVYLPNQKNPLTLPPASQSLMLLKRMRDEAHRFAISYHHNLRSRIFKV